MRKWLNLRSGILLAAVFVIMAVGIAYAVDIQRGVSGSVLVGRVETPDETVLVWRSVEPSKEPLGQLDFGTTDINAFGLLKRAFRVPLWVENGGDVTFALRVDVTDVRVDGRSVGDVLALDFGPEVRPTPTAAPKPTSVLEPTATPQPVVVATATPTLAQPVVGGAPVPNPESDDASTFTSTTTPTPGPRPTPKPPVPRLAIIEPGQVVAFKVGLRLLRSPEELGIGAGSSITFTAIFRAEGPIALPPTPTPAPRPTPVPTAIAVPTATPRPVEPKVEVLEVALDPVFFDTNLTWMGHPSEMNNQTRHMGDSIIDMDPFTGLMVPGLGLEWEMTTPDAKTWVVKLRQGIPFHDGWGEFTAKDLVHSYSLVVSEESPASVSRRWRQLVGTTVNTTTESNDIISEVPNNIKIIDDYTVEFNLLKAEIDLPAELSANLGFTFMMSENFWKNEGRQGYIDKFIGTGSWKFRERVVDQFLSMDRDETNWQKVPDFKGLRLNWSREPATRLAQLLTEEVHMATLPRSLYSQAKTEGMVIFSSTIPANGVVIGFGGLYLETSPYYKPDVPFLDKRVRQAINHALNRDEINREIFDGAGEPMYVQGYHWSQLGWNPDWETNFERDYGYDPDKASALIKEAFPNGFKIQSLVPSSQRWVSSERPCPSTWSL